MKTAIPTLEQRFVAPVGSTAFRPAARLGFIGAGAFICAHHLPTAHHSRNMTVGAIADLNADNLRQRAEQFSPGYVTPDYRKVLSDPEIDIVVIGTKDDLHARLIVESLDAGKWVFCEKPMAETTADAETVLSAERRNPACKLAVGFNRRFSPAYADAKKLMQRTPRPWFINYRLMAPNPEKQEEKNFYADRPRILYEGTHILDLVCWFLDATPTHVFMSGDRYLNNCCVLEFADGSHVSFMCGSMGSFCLWKEYMECFSRYAAITVSEFIDMRVRGIPGEFDRLYSVQRDTPDAAVRTHGFDFFETLKVDQYCRDEGARAWWRKKGLTLEEVRRPTPPSFDLSQYRLSDTSAELLQPDKGWVASLEHFAKAFLNRTTPENADGRAGKLSTDLAIALLRSLDTAQRITLD